MIGNYIHRVVVIEGSLFSREYGIAILDVAMAWGDPITLSALQALLWVLSLTMYWTWAVALDTCVHLGSGCLLVIFLNFSLYCLRHSCTLTFGRCANALRYCAMADVLGMAPGSTRKHHEACT